MTITQMKWFLTAADCLNFSKAADQLGITQPTLSRQIANMEKEWNLPLFIREGRKMQLTPAGRALADTLSVVYENYCTAVEQAQSIQKGLNGSLRVGVLHGTYVADFLPTITRYFQKKHPNVEITYTYDSFQSLQNKLYSNQLDVAFTVYFSVKNKEYLLHKFVEHSVDYLLMHKDNPLARKKEISLADCKEETFVLISAQDCPESSSYIIEACHEQGFFPKIVYTSTLYDLMLNVETGKGITILDTRNLLHFNPHIRAFPLKESRWDPSLVAAWNQTNYNPVIPVFMAQLDQFVKKTEEDCSIYTDCV